MEAINQSCYEYVKTFPDFSIVLEAILQLMREPQPDDALMASIGTCGNDFFEPTAEQYVKDRDQFVKSAIECTKTFAKP